MEYILFGNQKIWPVEASVVTAYVGLDPTCVFSLSEHSLRDRLHIEAVGAFALRNLRFSAAWACADELVFKVQGQVAWDAFEIEPTKVFSIEKVIDHYTKLFGWTDEEVSHAKRKQCPSTVPECTADLGNGRELKFPSKYEMFTYLRICQCGFEISRLDLPADELAGDVLKLISRRLFK